MKPGSLRVARSSDTESEEAEMMSDDVEQKTREIFENLRRRISGCTLCETGHDPGTHMAPAFPGCNNLGQEVTWVCENGHQHFMDLLMAASSIHLEPEGIRIMDGHLVTLFLIRVTDGEQPAGEHQETGDNTPHTFTIRAGSGKTGLPWWEYDGPAEEKRENLNLFMQAVVYAEQDPQAAVDPELAEVPPSATAIVAAESCSLTCEEANELRALQASSLGDHAEDWEDLNLHREVGEEVVRAVASFRGEPMRIVLEMEGRQVHVLISLPPRDGAMEPDDARVVRIFDWPSAAHARIMQSNDAWEREGEEDDDEQE